MTKKTRISLFQRAAVKVTRSLKAGSLPEKLEWAS
jgi:hypothetical protein